MADYHRFITDTTNQEANNVFKSLYIKKDFGRHSIHKEGNLGSFIQEGLSII